MRGPLKVEGYSCGIKETQGVFRKTVGDLLVDRAGWTGLGVICAVDFKSSGGRGRGPAPWTKSTSPRWTKRRVFALF
jgi:hypothetical protein